MTGPAISVVVCTLGRNKHLPRTITALLGQTLPAHVIVVDNDPGSEAVSQLLRGHNDHRLRLVRAPRRGLSHARNVGLRTATTPLVAFTDDDAVPDETWLANLAAVFDADASGQVTCVTGRVLAARGDRASDRWFEEGFSFDRGSHSQAWSYRDPGSELLLEGVEPGSRGPVFPYAGGEFGSGNNMAFRTDWLRMVGGFDEALGAGTPARGGEDLDMFRRVQFGGRTLVYAANAIVRHEHRPTFEALRRQAFDYGAGMAASVTVMCLRHPRRLGPVIRHLPAAARLLFAANSAKNSTKSASYPAILDRRERIGYALGPGLAVLSLTRLAWLLDRRRRHG